MARDPAAADMAMRDCLQSVIWAFRALSVAGMRR